MLTMPAAHMVSIQGCGGSAATAYAKAKRPLLRLSAKEPSCFVGAAPGGGVANGRNVGVADSFGRSAQWLHSGTEVAARHHRHGLPGLCDRRSPETVAKARSCSLVFPQTVGAAAADGACA